MADCKKAIINTLAYADIFDYPLSKEQIWQYLLTQKPVTKDEFEKKFPQITKKLSKKYIWYAFAKRADVLKKRQKREKESTKKIHVARKLLPLITWIPTLQLVGISGNVAMFNAEKNDDIDLFLVTKKHSLWITRLLVVGTLFFLGKLRKKRMKKTANKLCVNMLVTEDGLELPKDKQNIYTAHEVIQMIPLFSKHSMYKKYIAANSWVLSYLPNVMKKSNQYNTTTIKKSVGNSPLFLEKFAKKIQLFYMHADRTIEYISDTMIAFHPQDNTEYVIKEYEKRRKYYATL